MSQFFQLKMANVNVGVKWINVLNKWNITPTDILIVCIVAAEINKIMHSTAWTLP